MYSNLSIKLKINIYFFKHVTMPNQKITYMTKFILLNIQLAILIIRSNGNLNKKLNNILKIKS